MCVAKSVDGVTDAFSTGSEVRDVGNPPRVVVDSENADLIFGREGVHAALRRGTGDIGLVDTALI